jgi:hypothetical protein
MCSSCSWTNHNSICCKFRLPSGSLGLFVGNRNWSVVQRNFDGFGLDLKLNSHENESVVYLEPGVMQNFIVLESDSGGKMTQVKEYAIYLCEECINGIGKECHTPGCGLFLHTVDLPIHREALTEIEPIWDDDKAVGYTITKEACRDHASATR